MGLDESPVSRRAMLTGTATGLFASLTGCSGVLGHTRTSKPITILSAGSLHLALSSGLNPEIDHPIQIESHGSVTVARMVAEKQRDPDIIAVADPSLFNSVLNVPWFTEYASNAIVLAYNSETTIGKQIAKAQYWYEPLLNEEAIIGRTDPDLDPLGFRTLFTLRLASDYYKHPRLADKLRRDKQIYPETELLSHFETGALDAAFVYRNMAVERDYPYVELPYQINLSKPKHIENWYSTVSYILPEGETITGDLISYSATIHDGHLDDTTQTVFKTLIKGHYLEEFGFLLPSAYPTYTGHVPDTISQ